MSRTTLRLLQCLAAAFITLVCAGVASPAQGIGRLAASLDAAGFTRADGANTARRAPERSHSLRDGGTRRVCEVIESDASDDDALSDAADGTAIVFDGAAFSREPGRAPRCQVRIDTSRFAVGTGLPRGPPTT